jgi:hypothetical protein
MIKCQGKYLGYNFCVGSPYSSVYSFLLLGLLLFGLLTSLLFLNLLHGLLHSRRLYHIGPHRNCGGRGPSRDRFLAAGLNLGSRKTPGSNSRDWGIFRGRAGISDCGGCTLALKNSLSRFGLLDFSFLNFAEPDRDTRRLLPFVVLGPNSLDRRGMNGDGRGHLGLTGWRGMRLLLKLWLWLNLRNSCFRGRRGFLAKFGGGRFESFTLCGWWDVSRRLYRNGGLLGNFTRLGI